MQDIKNKHASKDEHLTTEKGQPSQTHPTSHPQYIYGCCHCRKRRAAKSKDFHNLPLNKCEKGVWSVLIQDFLNPLYNQYKTEKYTRKLISYSSKLECDKEDISDGFKFNPKWLKKIHEPDGEIYKSFYHHNRIQCVTQSCCVNVDIHQMQ